MFAELISLEKNGGTEADAAAVEPRAGPAEAGPLLQLTPPPCQKLPAQSGRLLISANQVRVGQAVNYGSSWTLFISRSDSDLGV